LAGGALCNDASLHVEEAHPRHYQVVGDPTEGALAVAAARAGLLKAELEQFLPRVAELPFDAQRKRMTTIHRRPAVTASVPPMLALLWASPLLATTPEYVVITKGAFDSLLTVASKVWVDNRIVPLDAAQHQRLNQAHNELAQQGMRVLGLAVRGLATLPSGGATSALEQDLIFVGLIGMIDPPRREVKLAVQTCQDAGIRPMMITGDHPLTARHIAQQLAIGTDNRLLTGAELDQLSPEELQQVVEEVAIYARVSPAHKLNIVEALQQRGHIVAMTGDGVNDAPALKKADIGIAMGITGADVAKEAAEMVLQDDNFTTIVAAVEEGRVIYDNIRKFIKYLLSCNSGELWIILLAPLLGMPLPLLPLQILWMNLVTDGLPALALGVEQAERNAMRRPPYPPQENIFSRGVGRDILWIGLLMGLLPLALGYFYWRAGHAAWQTQVFSTLTLAQLALALALRSEHDSLFQIGLSSNRLLLLAVGLTVALQLAVIYMPLLQHLFATVPLSLSELVASLSFSTLLFWGVELQKWLRRRWQTTQLVIGKT
jgi:Ca2+-transporting ATPase